MLPSHEPPPHPFPLPIRWEEGGRRSGEGWFMVPMRAQKRMEALHKPRSSRREEAYSSNAECGARNAELSQSLLMAAATVQGFNARNFFSPKKGPCSTRKDAVHFLRQLLQPFRAVGAALLGDAPAIVADVVERLHHRGP